jgi:phosphoglycerate dehydrogenase-like enzyme
MKIVIPDNCFLRPPWSPGTTRCAIASRAPGYRAARYKAEPFANADVLSLHVRLTLATQRIVGPENLAR